MPLVSATRAVWPTNRKDETPRRHPRASSTQLGRVFSLHSSATALRRPNLSSWLESEPLGIEVNRATYVLPLRDLLGEAAVWVLVRHPCSHYRWTARTGARRLRDGFDHAPHL